MKALCETGADVNGSYQSFETPLITAAVKGDCAILKTLVEAGADCDLEINSGIKAIM